MWPKRKRLREDSSDAPDDRSSVSGDQSVNSRRVKQKEDDVRQPHQNAYKRSLMSGRKRTRDERRDAQTHCDI